MKKKTRRSFIKSSLGAFLSLAGTGFGGKYYVEQVEPKWLEVNSFTIAHKLIPKGFNSTKIVQFSDTHLGFQFQLADLQSIILKINRLQPDIIFFTGDLMDAPNEYTYSKEIIPVLRELKAPLGKFCVYGNHDHGGYGTDLYKNIMEQSGFTLLKNQFREIKLLNRDRICIAGIDEPMLGRPNVEQALTGSPDVYRIMLSHAPDLADEIFNYGVHLQLSGHSHGGQVQIPFYGTLVTPPFAEKYPEGFYSFSNNKLYVNRGLGTTRLPYRFLSRPEMTVFELQSL
ncbi:putative MPP superfamily phosphohydrolase [Peribacillus deserti]|uniref:MPP superfamily phosphohydrolase n=1 Tax=Peribacillus deserti TaxID=673318 RepID=A0ABS2QQV7_9BACI|nr:metallophosphoesterase [Peribacillus deserti]MBM7694616.1 putative MPP superfamily phosphohydrolase [Peribacillus deserti]